MTRLIFIYFCVVVGFLFVSCIEKPIHGEVPSNDQLQSFGRLTQDIQQSLNRKEVLLNYRFRDNGKQLEVSVIDHSETKRVPLALPNGFEEKIKGFHQLIQQFSLPQKSKRAQFVDQSHELYLALVHPIRNYISGRRLIIVAKGVLQLLPFEVLIKSDRGSNYSDLSYLIKDHAISYHLSENEFLRSRRYSRRTDSFLGFAPVFGSRAIASSILSPEVNSLRSETVRSLPYSKKELLRLLELFNTRISHSALEKEATESWLKEQLKQKHEILHLASHSFSNLDNPQLSGILCSKDGQEDGVLRVNEISKMKIESDLVVLSSCESGVGKIDKNNKMQGIHKSFIEAGAANVLYSLWKVNDKVSSEMMIDFYSNFMIETEDYATALRVAKLNLIQNRATASPNLWAPFVLMGR